MVYKIQIEVPKQCNQSISQEILSKSRNLMEHSLIINLEGSKFPFGQVKDAALKNHRRIFIKNKVFYKTETEYQALQEKLFLLKKAHHSSFINIQLIQEVENGCINIFYPYVHLKIQESSFNENLSIKALHQQLVKLIIHAAKHSLITHFDSQNCGIQICNESQILKYYLSISEITVSYDLKTIERSVQLFTVRSMQFLDDLIFAHHSSAIVTDKLNRQRMSFNFLEKPGKSFGLLQKNIFSERHLRNSMNCSQRSTKNDTGPLQVSDLSLNQKKQIEYKRSLEKSSLFQQEIKDRVQKVKQRSIKALLKLEQIISQIQKKTSYKNKKSYVKLSVSRRPPFTYQTCLIAEAPLKAITPIFQPSY